jgi:AcrR family transcriptional regulator
MTSVSLPRGIDTKSRILRSAERIFGHHGYAGTTLRAVTSDAGVNLAAANYHFGTKEALVMEMLGQRVAPINEERLNLLKEAKQKALSDSVPLEKILEALIMPLGEAARGPDGPDLSFLQLVGRAFTEPAGFLRRVHETFFRELADVFMTEIRRSCPQATEKDLWWNLHFTINAMLGSLSQCRRAETMSNGICEAVDLDDMLKRLVSFLAKGFRDKNSPDPDNRIG